LGDGNVAAAGPDFGDDLLRGIRAQPWHLRQPLHGGAMRSECQRRSEEGSSAQNDP
jgi:hypothetical protein